MLALWEYWWDPLDWRAKLAVSTATYTFTGNAATLTVARQLSAGQASYTLAGQSTSQAVGLPASTVTYTIAGSAITFAKVNRLACTTGTFTLTGNAAILSTARKFTLSTGTYALAANSAGLASGRQLSGGAAAYTLSGSAANIGWGHVLPAAGGAYTLSGRDALLLNASAHATTLSTVAFTVAGSDITFAYAVAATQDGRANAGGGRASGDYWDVRERYLRRFVRPLAPTASDSLSSSVAPFLPVADDSQILLTPDQSIGGAPPSQEALLRLNTAIAAAQQAQSMPELRAASRRLAQIMLDIAALEVQYSDEAIVLLLLDAF